MGALVAALVVALPGTASAGLPDPPPSQAFAAFCDGAPTSSDFTDVSSSNVHEAAIACLVASEITSGKTADTYDPSGSVTRAQMTTFLAKLVEKANERELTDLTELPAYDGTSDFDDVPQSNVHFTSIMRLSQAGITSGTGPRRFSPDRAVNREQMAAFVNRTVAFLTGEAYTTADDYFTDDEASFAEADINGIASRGIAVGDGRDLYAPGANVARDQMGSFLIRSLAVLHADDEIKALNDDPEASDGPINGTGANAQGDANKGAEVRSTNKEAGSFIACDITTLDAHIDTVDESRCFTYNFAAGDTFLVGGNASALAAFVAELSPYDDVTGMYNRDAASTFSLRNEAALPPEAVTATAEATAVTLTIDDSTTPSVDRYNIYRAAARTIPGTECQEPGLTFARIGEARDPSPTADSGNAIFPDATVEPDTDYCYKVFSVDDGDESTTAVATGLVTTPVETTAAAGAPTSIDVRLVNGDLGAVDEIDAGDEIILVFNESMATPDNGDSILVEDDDGTLAQIACGTRTQCDINSSAQTVGSTSYGAGRVITLALLDNPSILGDSSSPPPPPPPPSTTPPPPPNPKDSTTNEPATIIGQGGYQDVGGATWNLQGSADKIVNVDDDVVGPASIDVQVQDRGLLGFLDSGDTIVLVFDEVMRAPDTTSATPDTFDVTGSGAPGAVKITCGQLRDATCTRSTADQMVGTTSYPAGMVINVTLTATPTSAAGPARIPAKVTGQSGFQDAATNQWDLCKSTDLTINSVRDTGDAGTTACPAPAA